MLGRSWDNLVSYFSDLILLTPLFINAFASVVAGFAAALVARENTKTPLILSVMVLIVVISVQLYAWDRINFRFHLAFWASLIPMMILGGKLKKTKGNSNTIDSEDDNLNSETRNESLYNLQ